MCGSEIGEGSAGGSSVREVRGRLGKVRGTVRGGTWGNVRGG